MSRTRFIAILCAFIAMLCVAIFISAGCDTAKSDTANDVVTSISDVVSTIVYDSPSNYDNVISIITPSDPLPNHKGRCVIESIYGVVLNDDGDGRILNTDFEYDYIHYDMSLGFKVGDIVQTVCVYNPVNNYEDDIVRRDDFIVEQGQYQLIEE